jgi:hypothetical protein
MTPETDDLEKELRRNLKLRHELGSEVRLEFLINRAAATGPIQQRGGDALLATIAIKAAWVTVGLVGLALAAGIALRLT